MMILLTNDDGYRAAGLAALRESLSRIARVVVVAPATEMSGVSHALTLSRPLRVETLETDFYILDGTPTDCMNFALNRLLSERPAACVSGINHGPNLGDDVSYSGTVGAAFEATLFDVPAVAVSHVRGRSRADFHPAADLAAAIAGVLARRDHVLPPGTFLNVNVPEGRPAGVSATRLARRRYLDGLEEHEDPRGHTFYWVGGKASWDSLPGTDHHAVTVLRHVSVSLLGTDYSRAAGDVDPASLAPVLAPAAALLADAERPDDVAERGA